MNYEEIAKQYITPLFIYDIDSLTERVNYLKNKLSNTNIVYAVKANTFIAEYLEDKIDRYEICSPGEFEICNSLNIDRNKMVISGVYKDLESIENMIKNYSDILKYTIESKTQWELLKELTSKYNRHIHVLIRLTSGNQFGVNESEVIEIIKDKTDLITIDGIEYFSGTQKHSIKRINKEIDYLLEFINNVEEETGLIINEIEYGPGLPVFYFKDDLFDEDAFLSEVNESLNKIKNKKISLEIGRSIASSCGTYITKVVDIKTNKNGNFVIIDGGINHLVYYGSTMAMKIPHYELLPKKVGEIKTYNIYGSLCTINDCLVKNIEEREINIGDTFVFKNTGAYSITEGIALFLSRNLPSVLIKKDNIIKLVRESLKTSEINKPNY